MNREFFHNTYSRIDSYYKPSIGKICSLVLMALFLLVVIFFANVSANLASFWSPVKAYNTPLQDLVTDFFNFNLYTNAYLHAVDALIISFCAISAAIIILNRLAIYILLKLMFCISISYIFRITTVLVTSLPDSWNMGRRTVYDFYSQAERNRGGDLIFSGHTLLACSFAHAWSSFYLITDSYALHWITGILAWAWVALILVLILVGRLHYTIDVLLGIYIASGVWWTTSYFETRIFKDPVSTLKFRERSPAPLNSASLDRPPALPAPNT